MLCNPTIYIELLQQNLNAIQLQYDTIESCALFLLQQTLEGMPDVVSSHPNLKHLLNNIKSYNLANKPHSNSTISNDKNAINGFDEGTLLKSVTQDKESERNKKQEDNKEKRDPQIKSMEKLEPEQQHSIPPPSNNIIYDLNANPPPSLSPVIDFNPHHSPSLSLSLNSATGNSGFLTSPQKMPSPSNGIVAHHSPCGQNVLMGSPHSAHTSPMSDQGTPGARLPTVISPLPILVQTETHL